jgi:hypothetical protein
MTGRDQTLMRTSAGVAGDASAGERGQPREWLKAGVSL